MPDYRLIPSIEQLRQRAGIRALEGDFGRDAIVAALREAATELRAVLAAATDVESGSNGTGPAAESGFSRVHSAAATIADAESAASFIEAAARKRLAGSARPSLRPVVNATGVIIHTNLGRSPLPPAALERVAALGGGYSNLEYDLAEGRRGARDVHAEQLLCRLLGVEGAVVVNNNAAATMLLLAALAAGREVIVSRGELVEIGGGFRVPDVMEQSGARLREVGTTNKTRVADYAAAISDRTALLLRVHRSNFRIEGFTEQPSLEALVALGRERGVPVAEDLGGGYVGLPGDLEGGDRLDALLRGEPKVQASVAAGVDVCCFSGDKLLGGPQAGIIVGRRALVDSIRRHALMRALRVDKVAYAVLEATLGEYVAGRAARTVPILRMILASPAEIEDRCRRVRETVPNANSALRDVASADAASGFNRTLSGATSPLDLQIVDGVSTIGGGTTPGLEIPTRLLSVTTGAASPDAIEAQLRRYDPPVIARIENDRVLLDLRTVLPDEDAVIADALKSIGDGSRL
jgi:L-seryl-tRNA(Ser) seleniumtransferase